jgi:hypothetical protein
MHRTIYGISVNKDGYKSPVSSKIFWFMIITCKNDDQTTNVNKNANGGILGIRALICGDKSLASVDVRGNALTRTTTYT